MPTFETTIIPVSLKFPVEPLLLDSAFKENHLWCERCDERQADLADIQTFADRVRKFQDQPSVNYFAQLVCELCDEDFENFFTCVEEAESMPADLVENNLAVCVTILPL